MSIEPSMTMTTQQWIKENHPESGSFDVYYTKDLGVSFDDEGYGKRYEWSYKDGKRADGKSYGWWPNIPEKDSRYNSKQSGWDGSLKLIFSWKDGVVNGDCIEYYDNKNVFWEGKFIKGVKDGLHKEYHYNGNLRSVGNYKNGQPINRWETYYLNGKLNTQSIFDSRGIQTVITKNDIVGNSLVENGCGSYEEYHSNNNLKLRGKYIDGYPSGKWVYYNNDGSVSGYSIYKDGKIWDGMLVDYYENGTVNRKAYFKGGRLDKSIKYFESGNMEIEEEFRDGKRYLINQYDYQGNILVENGNGKSDIVSMDGGIVKTIEYKDGEMVLDV